MAQPTAQAQQNKPVFSLDTFLKKAQPQKYRMNSTTPYFVEGGRSMFLLPQSGAASELMVNISGSITIESTTITAGKWANLPYPAPFSMIRNLSLTSNQNLQLINVSGWGWYKWVRERYGIDPFSAGAVGQYSDMWNTLLGVGAQAIQPGADVEEGVYPINMTLPIPLAYNKELLCGLLALQSNSINYPLTFQWGNIAGGISATGGSNDLFDGLVGTGISITADINVTVDAEIIKIPRDYPPNTSMFMSILESTYPNFTGGQNIIRPAPNDLFTMVMLEGVNNGAALDPADIANVVWLYSGNNRKFDEDVSTMGGFDLWQKGIAPTDGSVVWDLGCRRGLIQKRDLYDAFNDSQVTDLQLQVILPNNLSVVAPAQWTLLVESLRFVKQR